MMRSKPSFCAAILSAMLAVTCLSVPRANAGGASDSTLSTMGGSGPLQDEITPDMQRRVKKGLDWLSKNVNTDAEMNASGVNPTAIMALAGIAFVADGNLPQNGPYGRDVERIADFILKNCQESGLIASQSYASLMYGHGFATLFLSEVYGMSPRPDLQEKLQNAIRLIVQTQNSEGGWRYQPVPQDADLSVTICEVMALRAARNAGIKVPRRTIDRAIDYAKKLQEPDGGFAYMTNSRGSGFSRSAAGVACLYYMGLYDAPEIKRGLKYLLQRLPGKSENSGDYNYFYGNYYATQAMFMSGGDAWAQYWPAIRKEILSRQQADGSWSDQNGPVYATSMSLIILQVPNRLLPILQK